MKFQVMNRYSGDLQFEAVIEATGSTSFSVKLGLAVKWARKTGANLYGADLRGADLRGANLYGADLRGADLKNLPQDYINQCSRDILFIFQCLKVELPEFRKKLIAGEIDGTQYKGDCACLIGTMANLDGGIEKVCKTIPFYKKGTHNPGEAWFLNIHQGDIPKNNEFSAHVLRLIDMVLDK